MLVFALLYLFSGNLITDGRQPASAQPPLASEPYVTPSSGISAPRAVALLADPEAAERERGK
jgi:hypothetical protein